MNDRLAGIRQEILNGIEQKVSTAGSRAAAFELRKQFLDSKTGKIGQMMKEMKNIAPEERAGFGKNINELKEWAQQKFSELDEKLKAKELERRYESEKIDVTMPAQKVETGNLHPVTQIRNQLMAIFAPAGYLLPFAGISSGYPDQRGADPYHGEEKAAHQDCRCTG